MINLEYKEIKPINFNKAVEILSITNDVTEICNILLSVGFYYRYDTGVEDLLYSFFNSENIDISRSAILGLGHLVRIKKQINKEKLLENLEKINFPMELQGVIEDLLDDINIFVVDNSYL